jgi:hypothetical protein
VGAAGAPRAPELQTQRRSGWGGVSGAATSAKRCAASGGEIKGAWELRCPNQCAPHFSLRRCTHLNPDCSRSWAAVRAERESIIAAAHSGVSLCKVNAESNRSSPVRIFFAMPRRSSNRSAKVLCLTESVLKLVRGIETMIFQYEGERNSRLDTV